MTSFVRWIVLASAIVFLGGAGVASAQVIIVIDPPPGCPDVNATLEITKQPVANNLQQVTTEFKWGNNTGIKEVKVRMLKKDGDGNYTVEVGTETIATMQATGSRVNKLFPAAAQPATTKVKIEITTYAMDNTVIKTKTSDVVTLP